MAGSSSDEDENYWPGYVDALTTMTMVLTFLMMILGVMVFVLSQDAVSSKLGMLARALKIESRQLEKLNQVEIEDALRRAVAMKDAGDGIAPSEAGERIGNHSDRLVARSATSAGSTGPGGNDLNGGSPESQETGEPNRGVITTPGLGPIGFPKGMLGSANATGSGDSDRGRMASTFTGGLQGDKSAGPGGEYLVTNQSTGVAGGERGTGGRLEPGPGALRFVFERGAIDLPPAVAEALEAYVAAEGKGPLVIEASAVANEGGPSDARRKAYFRAMLIRSRLIKLGVDPLRIAVRIRDATLVTSLEVVDVMRPARGG
jgi:hypothetical protein